MAYKMKPASFESLVDWILAEYKNQKSIFGIPASKFWRSKNTGYENHFGLTLENPVGPAAGPHTQLAQNIISAYLTGGRFFELKTVQKLDRLELEKPCIDARDEGYNIEWSQELTLDESYDEYLKSWILIHFLKEALGLSNSDCGFIFNMSVGYDLEGIKSERMDRFIEELKDASKNSLFEKYIDTLKRIINESSISKTMNAGDGNDINLEKLIKRIDKISPYISNSVTLSTMHGCPPEEIESIASYLMREKNLHTYIKLNPTLLGCDFVKDSLHRLGYSYIKLDTNSFEHDLKFEDAVPMIKRINQTANERKRQVGVKLSNTLGVKNTLKHLAGTDMYMSGRALFPLTINLAYKIASEFNGELKISFSGGANVNNVSDIIKCGIKPVTMATELLKPGGYLRLHQISEKLNNSERTNGENKVDLDLLKLLAEKSFVDKSYHKDFKEVKSIKMQKSLPVYDCYIAPCEEACPIHQDIASYIKLIQQNKFEEALELILSKNPLPHITGYICDHQCMYNCTRWDYDEPVLIRELKKEAAIKGYDSYIQKHESEFKINKNNIRVAILGAGPAGLSAAYFLARAGFDVTIFEKEMNAGGIVSNILPKFRLPQEAIEKDITLIEKLGVRFVFGMNPGTPVERFKKEGHKYVYIAIGAHLSNKLVLSEVKDGIFEAMDFLKDFREEKKTDLGKRVAVIGGGNSAMDSARAAVRCEGVEKVSIIYRRTKEQMPADRDELIAALTDGVELKELLLPIKFENNILTCQKMKLGAHGDDGRASVEPIENQYEELEIDSVISAIGEHVDKEFLQRNKIRTAHGKAVVNQFNETVIPNIFIGGDALRGPATVVEAIADGKKVAETIIARENLELQSNQNPLLLDNDLSSSFENRKGDVLFAQVNNLQAESERCLGCNFVCNKCVDVCPNRANVAFESGLPIFHDKFQILHIDGLCNECGNCETFCPYQGKPYKDKLTIYATDKDFSESRSNGFHFSLYEKLLTVHLRWKAESGYVTFNENLEVVKSSFFAQKEIESFIVLIKNLYKNYSYLVNSQLTIISKE